MQRALVNLADLTDYGGTKQVEVAPGGSGRRINGKYEVNLWRSFPVEKRSGLRRLLTGNVNWREMICFRLVDMFCFVFF